MCLMCTWTVFAVGSIRSTSSLGNADAHQLPNFALWVACTAITFHLPLTVYVYVCLCACNTMTQLADWWTITDKDKVLVLRGHGSWPITTWAQLHCGNLFHFCTILGILFQKWNTVFLFGTMSLLKIGMQNNVFSFMFSAFFGSFSHQANCHQIEQT